MTDSQVPEPSTGGWSALAPRSLGSLGPVGPVALGCWRLTGDHRDNVRLVETAVDLGMNLIDNADVYGLDWGGTHFGACEEELGAILHDVPSLRERIVLATKGGIVPGIPYDSSPEYLVSACEASLRRMGVDHVDLYQIHRPDMLTHPAAVAHAFASLRERGLVREFGVSNHTVPQTRALLHHTNNGIVTTQPEFSAVHLAPMRDGTLDLCTETGITPLAWSPLAGGRLATGEGVPPAVLQVLDRIAADRGTTRSAVAVAFVLAHPSRPVAIVGTQQAGRLAELAYATQVILTRTEIYGIVQASEGVPLP